MGADNELDDAGLPERLGRRLAELIDVESVSGNEAHLAGVVAEMLGAQARDAGDYCVIAGAEQRADRPLVLLAGHLDTVPAQGNLPSRREDGVVHGLGAADMKGALAVMIEIALGNREADTCDLGLVFFPREELPHGDTALTPLLERVPGLKTADLAVVMEPTANRVQLGCLGNLNATWTFSGTAGHSARPWLAENAVDLAAAGVSGVSGGDPIAHEFEGLTYRQVTSAVTIHGGVAKNVIPDTCVVELNHRYAPGTTAGQAEDDLRARCQPFGGELVIDGNAPSGAVPAGNRLVDRLLEVTGEPAEPKQAWTPVAEFSVFGVDAVNFGPGDPAFAHRRDEQVSEQALASSYLALAALLRG